MSIKTKATLLSDLTSILTNGGLLTALEDRGMRTDFIDSLACLLGANSFVGNQDITGTLGVSGTITNTVLTASKLVKTGSSKELASSNFVDTDIQTGATVYAVASGTNTYVVTLTPVPGSQSAGNVFYILFTNANTGASTLNPNSLGAQSILYNNTALKGGEILAGTPYLVFDDGAGNYHLIGSSGGSGSYTPTLTNVLNLGASTAYECQYLRSGNVVTVSGRVDVDPTAAGSVQLRISLPISSNIVSNLDCAGVAFASGIAGMGAAILGDGTNNDALLQYIAVDTTNQAMYFTFTYILQ